MKFYKNVICSFFSLSCLSVICGAFAYENSYILACGKAQLELNKCIKEGKSATTDLFGSIASKITSGDMGKTAADKSADQAASFMCKDKSEKAELACKP